MPKYRYLMPLNYFIGYTDLIRVELETLFNYIFGHVLYNKSADFSVPYIALNALIYTTFFTL